MTLSYATKAKITKYVLPIVVIVPFVFLGYNATHNIFADSPAAIGISVNTSQNQYKVGQTIEITLSNATSANVYVTNNCPNEPLKVYRLENNQWMNIHSTADSSKCDGEPRDYMIPANRSIKADYHYWPDLFAQPGRYRIVANLESFSDWPSTEFSVIK